MTVEKRSAGSKTRPNATSSTTNTTQTEPEANLCLRNYRQANNSLSHGTANELLSHNSMDCQRLIIVTSVTADSGVFCSVLSPDHQTSNQWFKYCKCVNNSDFFMFRNTATCLEGPGFESRQRQETCLFSQPGFLHGIKSTGA
jgi:hypothetical protein